MQKQKSGRRLKMDAVNILRRAQDGLRRRGWTQNAAIRETGEMCSIGALHYACGGYDSYPDASAPLSDRALAARFRAESFLQKAVEQKENRYASVVGFNDRRDTTKEDVLEVFSKAITLARRAKRSRH